MSEFNPFQDQHFGGTSDLKFFVDMAPRRVMLDGFSNGMFDQGSEQACTGLATDVVLDVFTGYRGAPIDLSWSFIYWIARQFEANTLDTGVMDVSNVFKAMYLRGVCLQSLAPDLDASTKPSDEAFADAATRKVTLFQRIDMWDCKNAIITALAHGIPIAAKFSTTWDLANVRSTDPIEQMAAFNIPMGRIQPGYPGFLGFHFMPIIGYDLDLGCVYVHGSWGRQWASQGICAISFTTMVAQLWESYVVREFNGLTSYVDPKWIVSANANHDSAFMLKLRQYMYNVLTNTEITQLNKSQITRNAMPLFGVTAQDLADAAAPWGVTLQVVEDFLALSA